MTKKIAVIIPFYQKKGGILTKAVHSALRQVNVDDLSIIVVDDDSPISARAELEPIIDAHPGKITVITQPNAGPAAARNKALDNIEFETEYVAFLDSDDEWIDTHLSNALLALDRGYDFYFADHFQLNQKISAFNRAKRIQVDMHPKISKADHVRAYSGDMFDQILGGNIIGTSTVVYRHRKYPALRFREEFVYAGEDYLFWLELSMLTKRIAFSSICECTYGPGVNIFSGAGWGTEQSLIRIHYEMKYKKAVAKLFALTKDQRIRNRVDVSSLRRGFVADVLHRVSHGRSIAWFVLLRQFKIDPRSFIYFIPLAISLTVRR